MENSMRKTDDTIFLLSDGGTLERVPKADYDSEERMTTPTVSAVDFSRQHLSRKKENTRST
jgi:hypothetical protein